MILREIRLIKRVLNLSCKTLNWHQPKKEHMPESVSQLNYLAEHETKLYFSFDVEQQKFIYKNPAFMHFFETEKELDEVDGLQTLVHIDDREYLRDIYASLFSGEVKEAIEFRMVIQKKTYYLKTNVIATLEHPKQIIGHAEDITQQKTYTENLMEYTSKKNAVLNIVSHDLAGPLGSIQMLSSLLQSRAELKSSPEIQKILSMINTNAKRGVKMVQEFIKKEFLESIGVEVQKKRYNIVEKTEQLIAEYKSSELHLKLNFEMNCSQSEIYVMIDDVKFMQAINNLVSNSIKFTPDGGTISINIVQRDTRVLIEVSDTGIGIPKKFHEKLFDKFNLAGRTGLKGESSVGLGMSIIKTIIEWHQGKIWFNSEENKGTTFFIEIEQCF